MKSHCSIECCASPSRTGCVVYLEVGKIVEVLVFVFLCYLLIDSPLEICAGVVGGPRKCHYVVLESRTGFLNTAVLG